MAAPPDERPLDAVAPPLADDGVQGDPPPAPSADLPPLLEELAGRVYALHESPAPAFPTHGTALRGGMKRAVNVALSLAGRSQRRFNESVAEGLTLLMAELRGLRGWLEERAPLLPSAPDLAAALDAVRRQILGFRTDVGYLRDHVAGVADGVERLAERQAELATRLDALSRERSAAGAPPASGAAGERLAEQVRAVETCVAAMQEDSARWARVLERKYEAVALELRAVAEDRTAGTPEPEVVDPVAYARRLAAMTDGVRVNLGCGEQPWPDYVNVDRRALPGVDVVADARRLPFEPAALAELASAHLVEHFREHVLRTRVVPYWKSLLRPGGRLRIVCPNWEAMLDRLRDGRMSLGDFKTVTFGLQDYQGDDHFAMYTPETLTELLQGCGFDRVEVVARDRMNGLCPEMELVAWS